MFSTKAEYGIRVMAHLARRNGSQPISLGSIADAERLPLAYLEHLVQRLRKAVGPDVPIVVEKILGPEETLRTEWLIAGSTGYEFITALGHLLTDEGRAAELDAAYAGFIGGAPDYAAMAEAMVSGAASTD